MSENEHGIWTNLRGGKCACGEVKAPGKSFCRRDYFKLPRAMRNALYQSAGYVAAFRDALKFLGLEEPKAELPTLRDAFPTSGGRGPRLRNPRLFNHG